MILFTVFGLTFWQWFFFVDLPLSIIFIIIVIIKFPKIKHWFNIQRSVKHFIEYEYDEEADDEYEESEEADDGYEDDSSKRMLSSNKKRIDTMMKKYGVPYAFLLKDQSKAIETKYVEFDTEFLKLLTYYLNNHVWHLIHIELDVESAKLCGTLHNLLNKALGIDFRWDIENINEEYMDKVRKVLNESKD